ncbi:MAG: alpha/beta hydrolase [Gemmatimonadota bacterium]|nr:MAG: alpha/beta hydrolase [Gemmatimonadota bacterium]
MQLSGVALRKLAYVAAGLAVAAILFWAGGRLMLESLERQLIYFPTRVRADAATPSIPGTGVVEEVWLQTDDGPRVHGIYAGAPDAFADLLFFHGNAGNLYDRLDNVQLLVESGFNVLIMDYRGYGKSEGQPSERALYDDALLAYRHLTEARGVDPSRLVLFGRSLGSTVAIELATQQTCGALIVESAFTSAQELARIHYGWLPGALFRRLTHEFDSLSKVPKLRAPVMYIHGDIDAIVPVRMGQRLYEASPEPREWYVLRGAGHNDTLLVGGRAYFERLVRFVREHVAAG